MGLHSKYLLEIEGRERKAEADRHREGGGRREEGREREINLRDERS